VQLPGFPTSDAAKRALDLTIVVLAAPVWIPLMLGSMAIVALSMGRPVLFRQQRPGRGGRPFVMVKLRTMTDACDDSGALLPDDRRLTPIGKWLRRLSLDELPGLLNVVWGDMSLVGPRPLLMEYLPRYTADQARRHEARPGLTGWAQVNGRNDLSWEEKFALDVWYVDNRTLALDVRILGATLLDVLKGTGVSAPGHETMPAFEGVVQRRAGR
jgi:lipopolysaccharide/colanic/teichoic acid biosynthesis glycosyltransferase